jgi:hypothetical protein
MHERGWVVDVAVVLVVGILGYVHILPEPVVATILGSIASGRLLLRKSDKDDKSSGAGAGVVVALLIGTASLMGWHRES